MNQIGHIHLLSSLIIWELLQQHCIFFFHCLHQNYISILSNDDQHSRRARKRTSDGSIFPTLKPAAIVRQDLLKEVDIGEKSVGHKFSQFKVFLLNQLFKTITLVTDLM